MRGSYIEILYAEIKMDNLFSPKQIGFCVGAIISDIPMVDKIDISAISTGDIIKIDGENVEIIKK